MKTNKQKFYTLYEYNKSNNDITNLYETSDRQTASDKLGVNISNLAKYCIKAIDLFKSDNINLPRLQDNKYFIVIDSD